jgi:hypothetical protein
MQRSHQDQVDPVSIDESRPAQDSLLPEPDRHIGVHRPPIVLEDGQLHAVQIDVPPTEIQGEAERLLAG